MDIRIIRRILRRYGLSMRKRGAISFHSGADKDCPYEAHDREMREWRFNLNPEKYQSVEELERKINYELREEYIPPLG